MRLIACLALIVVPALPACELFGQVACEEDGDCPDSLPFCVEDFCAAEEDEDDEGRGIDSGCSAASEADDCPGGLCDEEGVFVEAETCLPPDDIDDCSNEAAVGAPPRGAQGPVIFALTYTSVGDGCFSDVAFSFFDREGNVSPTSPLIELYVSGSAQTQSPPFSEDGKTFNFGSAFVCGAGPDVAGLTLLDDAGNPSNTLCLRPPN
jgi:hypothetical protein